MPFAATWMNLEIIILSKVRQKEKDKYHMIYMWNLKYDTNEHIYQAKTDTDIENRLVVASGREGGGWGVWEKQMQTIIYRVDKQQGPTV